MHKLPGLTAATHTPFADDGELNLACVEKQAEHLSRNAVSAVFIVGTTGESHSLTVEERLALTERWMAVTRGSKLKVVVHVGANCLADSRTLAAQAKLLGVSAIAALSPCYFKPKALDDLIECSRDVAAAAWGTPFYYYDIPSMTGVHFSAADYLEQAESKIPSLVGVKFSNADLLSYQRCLAVADGRFDMPWGTDEYLLSALAVGASGAVGSSYNFAAPVYTRMLAEFANRDGGAARQSQLRGAKLIHLLGTFGYQAACRKLMEFLGVPVGPPRLPFRPLNSEKEIELRAALETLGFFDWIRNP